MSPASECKNTIDNFALLTSYVQNLECDCKKFTDTQQKSCAVRARKQLLQINKLCTEMRKDIMTVVKSKPKKVVSKKNPPTKRKKSIKYIDIKPSSNVDNKEQKKIAKNDVSKR